MNKNMRAKSGLAVVAAAAICGGGWWGSTVSASDHDEAPLVKANAALDITDLYVFDSGNGTTTIIVCWAGFNDSREQPDAEALYDEDALYTIWIDNNDDNDPDHQIYWRYGRNGVGDVGVQWEGIPGAADFVSGPVESVFDAGDGARVWSGHADDPFFFDAQGYLQAIDTGMLVLRDGTLAFDSTRDFLEGFNVTAAAIEIDTALIQDGDTRMQFWVTAAQRGG